MVEAHASLRCVRHQWGRQGWAECVGQTQGHATGDGSWGEESGQHVWDGQGHAIGGGCCGEAIGLRIWDRQTHAIGDGSCGWGYWAGVGQTIGDGSWGDVTGWCVWDNMSYANPCPPHACFHHLPCPSPFQNTARCAYCQFQCFPTCIAPLSPMRAVFRKLRNWQELRHVSRTACQGLYRNGLLRRQTWGQLSEQICPKQVSETMCLKSVDQRRCGKIRRTRRTRAYTSICVCMSTAPHGLVPPSSRIVTVH